MKTSLSTLLMICIAAATLYSQPQRICQHGLPNTNFRVSAAATPFSEPGDPQLSNYGGPFTPKGDIRFLVIYAGYDDETEPCNTNDLGDGIWPNTSIDQSVSPCKTFPNYYKDSLFYNDYSKFSANDQTLNLSNYFYQMSNRSLRVVADYFPERINVPAGNTDSVYGYIEAKYPNFDWSKYDNRKNEPDFFTDNSGNAPDGKLDYVIIVWRSKVPSAFAGIYPGSISTTRPGSPFPYYVINKGFTLVLGISSVQHTANIFLHEIAHTLYNCPHYCGVDGYSGIDFYMHYGWGNMSYGNFKNCMNAWERWYLGFIDIPAGKDLNVNSPNVTLTLKDALTTNDCIRIKLPMRHLITPRVKL